MRIWDIELLGRIVLWIKIKCENCGNYYRDFSEGRERQKLWKEIEKILGEDTLVARAIVNNNNE